jgi:peptide deformylase
MRELTIKKFPDPVLRKKASKIVKITPKEKEILVEMAKVMYMSQGVGLAATQVGIDMQLIVIDIGDGLINLINPVIVKKEGCEVLEEGCLSCPGLTIKIKRAKMVVANFMDEEGNARQLKAEGLLARAVQHELDHLSGVLIVDYLNPVKKMLLKRKLRKPLTRRN